MKRFYFIILFLLFFFLIINKSFASVYEWQYSNERGGYFSGVWTPPYNEDDDAAAFHLPPFTTFYFYCKDFDIPDNYGFGGQFGQWWHYQLYSFGSSGGIYKYSGNIYTAYNPYGGTLPIVVWGLPSQCGDKIWFSLDVNELLNYSFYNFSDFFTLNYPTSTATYPFAFNFTLNTSIFYNLFPDYNNLNSFKLLINYCNKQSNTTSTHAESCVPGTIHDSIFNYNIASTTYNTSFLSDVLYSGPAILWASVLTPDYYPIYVSNEYSFNVSSSVSVPPLIAEYFSTSTSTSNILNLDTTGTCSPPSGGFLDAPIENISYAICKTFSFLFIPSDNQRAYLKNTVFPSFVYSLRDAFPFQYIVQIYDSFTNTINYNPYSGEIVLSSASPPHLDFRIAGKDLTMPLTISSSSPFYSLYTFSQNTSKLAIYFIMVDIILLMFIF
jgi:hypothetical protein